MSASKYYDGWVKSDFINTLEAGYLTNIGWIRSVEERESIDLCGPVPWFTYASQRFISQIASKKARVCEYGCGGSTIWWALRTAKVTAIEHDLAWRSKIESEVMLTAHANHIDFLDPFHEIPEETEDKIKSSVLLDEEDYKYLKYAASPLRKKDNYDIVVIDGRGRNACAYVAAEILTPNGFIVFDNTDRDNYNVGLEYLKKRGFCRIDFWGMGPINPYEWCTTILFKDLSVFK